MLHKYFELDIIFVFVLVTSIIICFLMKRNLRLRKVINLRLLSSSITGFEPRSLRTHYVHLIPHMSSSLLSVGFKSTGSSYSFLYPQLLAQDLPRRM